VTEIISKKATTTFNGY